MKLLHPALLAVLLVLLSPACECRRKAATVPIPVSCWQAAQHAAITARGRVDAQAAGVVECALATDWEKAGALRIRVFSDRPTTVEVIAAEPDRRAGFWRRVDLTAGEQDLVLPLRWFRWRDGRVPNWGAVDRIALRFRTPATVVLSDGRLEAGTPFVGATDLEEVAGHAMRQAKSAAVRLLTDAPDLDIAALVAHLDEVAAALGADLPSFAPPSRPVPLVVLADREAFLRFVAALGRAYNADAAPPSATGYTLQGIGITYWDPAWGTKRPTFTHEYVHAWITAAVGPPSDRDDWFQEGMATRLQLRFHPQADLPSIVRNGLADPNHHLPLASLLDGRRLPLNRYWQAMTVVDHLLADWPDAVPALLRALRDAGSTNLLPHLGPVLGTDLAAFEHGWREATSGRYGGGEAAVPPTPPVSSSRTRRQDGKP